MFNDEGIFALFWKSINKFITIQGSRKYMEMLVNSSLCQSHWVGHTATSSESTVLADNQYSLTTDIWLL